MLNRILNLIEKTGLSDTAFSHQIAIGNGIIGKWRSGKQKPSLDAVIKIADYFHVSIDYLVYGIDPSDNPTPPNPLSEQDSDWLALIHQLPQEKQYEFHGELIGYLKALQDLQSKSNTP